MKDSLHLVFILQLLVQSDRQIAMAFLKGSGKANVSTKKVAIFQQD